MLAIHDRVIPAKLILDIFCSFTPPKDGLSAGRDKGRVRQGSHARKLVLVGGQFRQHPPASARPQDQRHDQRQEGEE